MAQQSDIQQQIIQLVQAAAQGDQKATQQIEQIMQAAQQGNQQAIQIAQMIQQVIQAMQQQGGQQKVMARYGTKLKYLQRLKGICPEGEELVFFEKGGKMCKACQKKAMMQKGGNTINKTKVAKKDIDAATYQKLPKHTQDDLDMHMERYAVSHNNNGSYNTTHKPTSQDSTIIDRKKMSAEMRKKYLEKKACGSKLKKRID